MSACYSRVRGPRSGSSTGTIVAAELSAEDVLRHYGRQLEASGWKAPGIGTTAALARGRWLRADSAGTSEVTLDVSEAAPGSRCYQVEMRISSP